MLAIYMKEMRSYFISAVGYVYAGVFLTVAALLCCYTTLLSQSYDTSIYFIALIVAFIVLLPLLTMKLFAEEKKLRTEQLLLTAPVSIWGMIFGKFLAAFTLFFGTVLVSCINFIPLSAYGAADGISGEAYGAPVGPVGAMIISSLVGIICIGAAFIALGMFISSLTENQLAAAIITVAIIVAMLLLDIANSYINNYAIRYILSLVCFMSRFAPFQSGLLDFSALLYYLSFAGVFLFLTVRVYDKRRWN